MKKLLAIMLVAVSCVASAETTPVMVSLFTPVQAPDSGYDVKGLRFSLIYGECQSFKGLDLGIVNRAEGSFSGLGIGGANLSKGRLYGGQLGFINWNGHNNATWNDVSKGAQIGFLNMAESFCGLQDGLINITSGTFTGLQAGFLNSTSDLNGVQCGSYIIFGVNSASGTVRGCQIGLVNYAEKIEKGIQIGLLNIISQGGWMPIFPFVNGSF